MWTHPRPKASNWNGQDWTWAHEKKDGFRLTLFKQLDGSVLAFGKDTREDLEYGSRFAAVRDSDWFKAFQRYARPLTFVDGEIFVEGQPASYVSTALRLPAGTLQFAAFATSDATSLEEMDAIAMEMDLPFAKYWRRDALARELGQPLTHENMLAFALECKYEGFVLKKHAYSDWYKLKAVRSVDAIVTGTVDGNGKHFGTIGSLRVSVYNADDKLIEIAKAGGMTDAERDQMNDNPHLLGRVCEVEYQYVGSNGRLRHPRFVRFRDDKPAEQCTLDQLQ